MLLKIDWDDQTTPYIDKYCYVTVRTGRSRAYRNILAGLGVRSPARAARLREDMDKLLTEISHQGGEALCMPNIPEMVVVKFDDYQFVIAHGIVFTNVTTGGRLVGDFKLVIVLLDEMDDVLSEVFKIEKYVQAALAVQG